MFSIQNVYMYAYQLIIYTSSSLSSLLVRKAWRNCSVLRTLCWIECWSSPSMVLLDWLYHTTYSSLTATMMDDEWKHGLFGRKKEKDNSDNNHTPSSSFLRVYTCLSMYDVWLHTTIDLSFISYPCLCPTSSTATSGTAYTPSNPHLLVIYRSSSLSFSIIILHHHLYMGTACYILQPRVTIPLPFWMTTRLGSVLWTKSQVLRMERYWVRTPWWWWWWSVYASHQPSYCINTPLTLSLSLSVCLSLSTITP